MTYSIRGLASWLVRSSCRSAGPIRNSFRFRPHLGRGTLEVRLPPGDALFALMSSLGFAPADIAAPDASDDFALPATSWERSSPVRLDFDTREAATARPTVENSTSAAPRQWLGNPEDAPTARGSAVRIEAPRGEVALAAATAFAIAAPPQRTTPFSPAAVRIESAPATALERSLDANPIPARATTARRGHVLPPTPTPTPETPAYHSRGTAHEMAIAPDRVAVRADGGRDAISSWADANGLTVQRWITDTIAVLQGPTAKGPSDSPGLTVVPVFVPKESGRDAIVFDEVIVRLQPGQTAEAVFAGDARIASYKPLAGTDDQFVATTTVGAGLPTLAVSNALDGDKRLTWAEPNFYQDWQQFYVPNDTNFGSQWHLNNTAQKGGVADSDVDAPEAWDVTQGGSDTVVVAVLDTGLELSHPDLVDNIWQNPAESAGSFGVDDDGNGWVDDVNGWDFTTAGGGDNDPSPEPTATNNDHATSVAGVIAAKGDNNLGVAGIAYRSKIMPVRIFGSTGASTSSANIASAIYYATGRTFNGAGVWNSASITNNSWGGGTANSAIQDAFNWGGTNGRGGKGVPSFISTGNESAATVSFPANLSGTSAGVIAVGSSTISDVRPSYSNYGSQIDFLAPSNGGAFGIVTTDRAGAAGYNAGNYTLAGEFGGTSSAAPLAAGTGALVLALAPDLTAEQLRLLMRNTTDLVGGASYDTTTGFNVQYGRGRINAFAAVKSLGVPEVSVTTSTKDLASGSAASFGTLNVGQTSTATYRVRNQGTTALNLAGLTASGSSAFSISTPLGKSSLALGESTSFAVAFAPTVGGSATGSVSFTTNDADEATFTIDVSGQGQIPSVTGKTFEDWNGNGTPNANDPALGAIRVFADANANATYDRFSVLNTVNLAIPDNNATGVSTSTTVTGQTLPLAGLTVKINLTHTYVSDLTLTLTAPNGTSLALAAAVGGSGKNFTNTVFDDAAATAIASGAAPFTGSFRPAQAFSAIAGIATNGVWSLKVVDSVAVDTGTLVDWQLAFDQEVAATGDANGNYVLPPLPNGTYTILPVAPAGWSGTGAGQSVTISAATPTFNGIDLGLAKNNRAYLRVLDDRNADGVFQATEPGVAGRLVYVDANDNGAFDPPGKNTYSTSVAVPILDNATVTSPLAVSGFGQNVTDVNVTVNLTHTYDGDLILTLIGPTGTRVVLSNRRGGSGDNFTGTVFDDQAATAIAAGVAPFAGSFRPEELLSKYNAAVADGTWTLEIQDKAAGDIGTLTNWSLAFVGSGDLQSATTGATGNASFDLAAGAANVRLDPLAGWKFTNPADGKIALTAAGVPLFESRYGTAEAVPPTVASSKIDVGTVQRSLVKTVTIAFSERVTFTGTPAAAVSIAKTGGGTVTPTATVDDTGAVTILTVGFANGTEFGSILDGDYTLAVDKTQVRDIAQNPMAANFSTAFFRLFGDSDGDRDVDTIDLGRFRQADGTVVGDSKFNPVFDFDSDGDIDTIDLGQLRRRFIL